MIIVIKVLVFFFKYSENVLINIKSFEKMINKLMLGKIVEWKIDVIKC